MKTQQKYLIGLFITFFASHFVSAQYDINGDYKISGKVGIGTDLPQSNLHISSGTEGDAIITLSADEDNNNESDNSLIRLRQDGGALGVNIGYDEVNFGSNMFGIGRRINNIDYWETFAINMANGNVGIGTNLPQSNLHISSGTEGDAIITLSADEDNSNESDNSLIRLRQDGGALGVNIGYDEANFGSNMFGIGRRINNIDYWETLVINTANGNVGIGTNNITSFKLSVNGNIRAKEIKVETGWSDFVFEDNYDLPTLEEVEAFIKTNKHLPEIPSAKEVEENGVELGKMDSKLLQKIEELTLYVIEQNKKIIALQQKVKILEKK